MPAAATAPAAGEFRNAESDPSDMSDSSDLIGGPVVSSLRASTTGYRLRTLRVPLSS